ncbi:MAG: putative manganese transporter, partial [Candidatus Krumholzibacteria bacterium]|nr:putative manganese transporter [Candidatus Krumholzibacteria bacterium]
MAGEILRNAVMITGFVFVMMLVIEYVNVLTSGRWGTGLARSRPGQYLLAALLGAVPGCLGSFAAVAMFSHRIFGLGALIAAMIATSGDEPFVMLALIPREAALLPLALFPIGIVAGAL